MSTISEGMEKLIESMNEKDSHGYVESESIGIYSSEDWTSVLDNDLLNPDGKEILAEKCPVEADFLPILKHIVMENGLGLSLAREIYRQERWGEMQGLLYNYKVNESKNKNERIHNLGSMLGDHKTFFWGLNILFSKSVMKGLKDSIWNKEGPARLSAIKSLDKFDIDDTEPIYVRALDDSDKEVRTVALNALKGKIPADRLGRILEEEQEEASVLLESIQNAKASIIEMMSGFGKKATSLGKNIFEKASSGIDFITTEAGAATSPIKSIWGKLTKKDNNEEQESPEAIFALCVALSWTDGKIEKSEKETLTSILKNNKLDKTFAYWLIERPEISELGPHLKQMKHPEKTITELAGTLKLEVKSETELEWLRDIERALGIEKKLFLKNEA